MKRLYLLFCLFLFVGCSVTSISSPVDEDTESEQGEVLTFDIAPYRNISYTEQPFLDSEPQDPPTSLSFEGPGCTVTMQLDIEENTFSLYFDDVCAQTETWSEYQVFAIFGDSTDWYLILRQGDSFLVYQQYNHSKSIFTFRGTYWEDWRIELNDTGVYQLVLSTVVLQ